MESRTGSDSGVGAWRILLRVVLSAKQGSSAPRRHVAGKPQVLGVEWPYGAWRAPRPLLDLRLAGL